MAATQRTIFYVSSNAEQFGRVIPKNSLIYCKETKILWENVVKAVSTDSLATFLSKVQLTVPAGTNALSDFKDSVKEAYDASVALPVHNQGDRFLCTIAGNGWNANSIYESRHNVDTNTDEWYEDLTSHGSIVMVENTNEVYAKNSSGVFVLFGTFIDKRPLIEDIEAATDNQTIFPTTISLSQTLEITIDGIETRNFSRDNANQITLPFGVSQGSVVSIKSFR